LSEPIDKIGPHFIRVASSVAANTASIATTLVGSIFINPTQSSTVNLYVASNVADTPAETPKRRVELTPFYKLVTGGVFLVAVICLLLQLFAVGYVFPEPTAAQANAVAALDYGWKMGFGVVIGLLTGKSAL
jgi:hypothetical protein